MRKIMLMLLAMAATINAVAADPSYTARAKVTMSSTSGLTFLLTLAEAPELGALNGAVMNMEGRKIALYGLNGTTKLQIVKGADLNNVKVGLLTDESTTYTINVSDVTGTLLYLYDKDELVGYALTEGAEYTFTATANSTDEDRFYLTKTLPDLGKLETCFTGTVLQINNNPYPGKIHVKWKSGTDRDLEIDRSVTSIDFTEKRFGSATNYTIEFGSGANKHAFNVTVTR